MHSLGHGACLFKAAHALSPLGDVCLQGVAGVRVILTNYNFTYTSAFTTLGIQGQADYYFAGTLQASVSLASKTRDTSCAEELHSEEFCLAGGAWVPWRLWRAWHLHIARQPACVQLCMWLPRYACAKSCLPWLMLTACFESALVVGGLKRFAA